MRRTSFTMLSVLDVYMQGTRHGDTMDVSTHSAHSMDLLSRCIEHGSVDTARTAVHAVHRDNTRYHVPGT